MKKIKTFEDYNNDKILFPRGGNIGGEHKKPISDEEIANGKAYKKGYKEQPKGITHSAHMIENEKRKQRKINLMGSELSGYHDEDGVQRLIDSTERYIEEPRNFWKSNIKDYLIDLPKGVAEHFDIDLNSDNVVDDFIKNNFELFKRSFEMFKEIKDYPTRYNESKYTDFVDNDDHDGNKIEHITYGDVKVGDIIVDYITDNRGEITRQYRERLPDQIHNGRNIIFETVVKIDNKWKTNGDLHRYDEYKWNQMIHKPVKRIIK